MAPKLKDFVSQHMKIPQSATQVPAAPQPDETLPDGANSQRYPSSPSSDNHATIQTSSQTQAENTSSNIAPNNETILKVALPYLKRGFLIRLLKFELPLEYFVQTRRYDGAGMFIKIIKDLDSGEHRSVVSYEQTGKDEEVLAEALPQIYAQDALDLAELELGILRNKEVLNPETSRP